MGMMIELGRKPDAGRIRSDVCSGRRGAPISQQVRLLVTAAISVAALAMPSVVQAETTSHVRTVAGRAQNASGGYSCGTAGGDPVIAHAFAQGTLGLPTEGYAFCNLSGSTVNNIGAGATSASSSASRAFNNGQANVAAAALADYDHIGAQASATYTGYGDGLSYHASEGAAIVDDALTFAGGTGTGYVKFGFSVDGSLTAGAGSESQIYLEFTTPGNTPQIAFTARIDSGGSNFVYAPYNSGSSISGFTANPGSVSGSGVAYTYGIGMTFGTPLDFEYGLLAYAYAAPFTGAADSNFIATARLTSILVTDSIGNTVDFSATSSSGTLYDAAGAHVRVAGAVPEPSTWAMMVGGFGLVGGAIRRRAGRLSPA